MSTYNTHLASEFYVLSMLHRLGADASLTLGNKKAVDIFVARARGRTVTIDVKGVAGKHDWPVDNVKLPTPRSHFFVLVSFEGGIGDPEQAPSCWVIPGCDLEQFVKKYRVRTVVSRALVRAQGQRCLNAWTRILGRGRVAS